MESNGKLDSAEKRTNKPEGNSEKNIPYDVKENRREGGQGGTEGRSNTHGIGDSEAAKEWARSSIQVDLLRIFYDIEQHQTSTHSRRPTNSN